MKTKVFHITCPEYNVVDLNIKKLKKVSQCVDDALNSNFAGQKIILRAVQSDKHLVSKNELIDHIIKSGSDYYDETSENAANVADQKIDLFGYACSVGKSSISYSLFEAFHIFKPKSLEKPQCKVDIWMIFDPNQLENVEYLHRRYNVIAKDGYNFKNPNDKQKALLGILIID